MAVSVSVDVPISVWVAVFVSADVSVEVEVAVGVLVSDELPVFVGLSGLDSVEVASDVSVSEPPARSPLTPATLSSFDVESDSPEDVDVEAESSDEVDDVSESSESVDVCVSD